MAVRAHTGERPYNLMMYSPSYVGGLGERPLGAFRGLSDIHLGCQKVYQTEGERTYITQIKLFATLPEEIVAINYYLCNHL